MGPRRRGSARSERPLAGYSGRSLYIRDAQDRFLWVPTALLQVDAYSFHGPHVSDYFKPNGAALATNLQIRRARFGMFGRVGDHFYYSISVEFGGRSLDEKQRPDSRASAIQTIVGYELHKVLSIVAGQLNIPFTMENVTISRWTDFMDRSLTTRVVAAPQSQDIGVMVRGETKNGELNYNLGLFGGDGSNRPSVDNAADVMGRFVFRPLATTKTFLSRAQVGFSGRYGQRDSQHVRWRASSMSTPGLYTFWSSSSGSGASEVAMYPSGLQRGIAGELFVPIERFDVRGEGVYVRYGRREAPSNMPAVTQRAGLLSGTGYYVQLGWWPLGEPRLNGTPGFRGGAPRLAFYDGPLPYALQVAARFEQIRLDYDSIARTAEPVPRGRLDRSTTAIKVDVLQLAVSYWANRHIRLTAQWSMYGFPGAPTTENQATAPGSKPMGNDPDARVLHEISARLAFGM